MTNIDVIARGGTDLSTPGWSRRCRRGSRSGRRAYAGFAIDVGSAIIAHLAVGDGPQAWGWAGMTGVLWGLSYFFWRRLQATKAGN